jgi:hypothetical protein
MDATGRKYLITVRKDGVGEDSNDGRGRKEKRQI